MHCLLSLWERIEVRAARSNRESAFVAVALLLAQSHSTGSAPTALR